MSYPIKAEQGGTVRTVVLARAPEQVASWVWDLDEVSSAGLQPALETAVRMAAVLSGHGLLEPDGLEWGWFAAGRGGIGIRTTLSLPTVEPDSAELARKILQCRPVGFEAAHPTSIIVTGYGEWHDEEGSPRKQSRLVELSVVPNQMGPGAEVSVFHDIWGDCDFQGHPHPELYKRNAPRLAAALKELDDLLGVACEPGEPTYFGNAEGYGVAPADLIDGLGPDLTDRL
ncbi:hypothetical protein [Streptomyces uncialis]|uniref:hypothetical protein n=1 Tax=Streptomyces uncialis TaxID=1048205 RepID=UPI00225B6CA6|nr:hypothetical protein [Streptomyces uncialis]MCX4660113.1 hypothetical protein [Streptomyces uncialis]